MKIDLTPDILTDEELPKLYAAIQGSGKTASQFLREGLLDLIGCQQCGGTGGDDTTCKKCGGEGEVPSVEENDESFDIVNECQFPASNK